ncbi:bacillithiol biosynthesis deacetylase BshB1 [Arachidicoccus rhizosphaerae]|uniref:Bacillithiol biosynthesis deacetylase BshB1 n=1 Tax=Arachidicoccus rhizosphaerae TaxID=551991 RepID=A0A1H3XHC9_9BACT|nr:bacillithiol biosynthesis deacetylase BshB1 [Arachidicoccus rhizosphaerae]SDZ98835.1 bacillithiol biosynthesis deacetylase BshB1 [Arachidicoccus rhizosphaerae]
MKVDILAVGVHPDDVELGCGGALIASVKEGKKVAVVDLTKGELGSRGTPETRKAEAEAASRILGLSARENLGMADGFFQINQENTLKVITAIRKYQPEVLICNAPHDRHPDHGRSSQLVKEAAFLSGLIRIETSLEGQPQAAWRPKHLYHYIQDDYIEPDFIFDITDTFEQRQESILSYTTQFNVVAGDGVQTYISKPQFMQGVEARARLFGKRIGAEFGEGYIKTRALGISSFDRFIL